MDLPGRRIGAPLVAWLFMSPLPVTMVVLDEHSFNLRGHSLGVDSVCADPEYVFPRESPEHPSQRDVGVCKDEGTDVEPLSSNLPILILDKVDVVGLLEIQEPVCAT